MDKFDFENFDDYMHSLKEWEVDNFFFQSTEAVEPSLYEMRLFKKDYVEKEILEHIMQKFLRKNKSETEFMIAEINNKGSVHCGTYNFEIAETKLMQISDFAKECESSISCVMEKRGTDAI